MSASAQTEMAKPHTAELRAPSPALLADDASPSILRQMLDLPQHWNILLLLVSRDISSRYRGSMLGKLWPLVHPLGQLLIYTFVFSIVLKIKFADDPSTGGFAIFFMTGLIAWSVFAESVSRAPSCILENPNLVTKVVFPTEVLPLVNVLSAVGTQFLAFTVLFCASILYLKTIHVTVLLLPLVVVPLLLFSAGLSWFLASLGVYMRDTRHLVSLALQAGMYATPILYPSSAVPEQYRWILLINPISGVVDDFRNVLLQGHMPSWSGYAWYTSISALTCFFGLWFFLKTKKAFSDVM